MSKPSSGRVIAYFGALVGLGISTTINVMHAVRASDEWWSPWLDGSWPVLLFIALEVLTRVRWGSGMARFAAWAGVGLVALVAGVESYWNLRSMMIVAHKEVWLATIGPLGIDGLMVACAAGLLARSEPAQESTGPVGMPTHLVAEAVQVMRESTHGPVHDRPTEPTHDRPSGPTHPASPQVTALTAAQAPVSQDAVDKVLAAVASGQPMGKAAIMAATGLSRSTAGRALTHLVAVGRLRTIGKATQPDYITVAGSAQQATHEASGGSAQDSAEATR